MNEKKDSNPKEALGIKKVPFHVIPSKPLLEVGLAMMEGGRKYGAHNYREIGVRMSTYYDAAKRHLTAWWEGEDIDPDSGIHHVVKAMASLFVVRDGMHMGNCIDDRPIRYPDGIDLAGFNKIAADLITKYPECAEPFIYHKSALADEYNAAEIDGPYVPKPGDVVGIRPRENIGVNYLERIKQANYSGKVVEHYDCGKLHCVNLAFHVKVNLYTDEIFLLKRED